MIICRLDCKIATFAKGSYLKQFYSSNIFWMFHSWSSWSSWYSWKSRSYNTMITYKTNLSSQAKHEADAWSMEGSVPSAPSKGDSPRDTKSAVRISCWHRGPGRGSLGPARALAMDWRWCCNVNPLGLRPRSVAPLNRCLRRMKTKRLHHWRTFGSMFLRNKPCLAWWILTKIFMNRSHQYQQWNHGTSAVTWGHMVPCDKERCSSHGHLCDVPWDIWNFDSLMTGNNIPIVASTCHPCARYERSWSIQETGSNPLLSCHICVFT